MISLILVALTTFVLSFLSSYILDKKNKGKFLVHLKNGIIASASVYIVNMFYNNKTSHYLNQAISTGNPTF